MPLPPHDAECAPRSPKISNGMIRMCATKARDDRRARELPPNKRYAIHVPTNGIDHDAVRDAESGAGQQIVEQRVPEEAVGNDEHEERHADEPVQLPRPAERAGEKDAADVRDDRPKEDERGPVVHLPHQQPGADVEAQPHADAYAFDIGTPFSGAYVPWYTVVGAGLKKT